MIAIIDEALRWGGILVCSLVLIGCICRVDIMKSGRSKRGWLWMYTLVAPFAAGVLIDLSIGRPVDWYACFGIAAFLLHLVLTRRIWANGEPAETKVKS